jgi:hypothetical protein
MIICVNALYSLKYSRTLITRTVGHAAVALPCKTLNTRGNIRWYYADRKTVGLFIIYSRYNDWLRLAIPKY